MERNPVPLISESLKQASPLARELLFWDLNLGRGYSLGERGSWRQPCTLGVSCLTVLARFQLSGGNVFSFIPAKTRQHGRRSCRRALHKLEVTWEQPGVSVKATCDWHSSIWSKVFLGSSDDSQYLSFLFVYCLVFTHYSSVLLFLSCKKMKNITAMFPFSLGFLTFFLVQGFTNRKIRNSLGSSPLRWYFWRVFNYFSVDFL